MLLNPYRFGFTPLQLPNLAGWWDFSDASTVTLNGSDVSQIDDKSGNGHDLLQATAGEQPAYVTPGQNGLNTCDANDANGDSLATSGAATYAIDGGDYYLAATVEGDKLGSNRMIFAIEHPSWVGWKPLNGAAHPNIYDNSTTKTWNSLTGAINTPQVNEWWREGTSIRVRLDGTIDTDVLTSSQSFWNNRVWRMFNRVASATGGWVFDGEIFELIFCDDLPSSDERDACKDYLTAKWGV